MPKGRPKDQSKVNVVKNEVERDLLAQVEKDPNSLDAWQNLAKYYSDNANFLRAQECY